MTARYVTVFKVNTTLDAMGIDKEEFWARLEEIKARRNELTEEQCSVLQEVIDEKISRRQAAQLMGCSTNTVYARLHRYAKETEQTVPLGKPGAFVSAEERAAREARLRRRNLYTKILHGEVSIAQAAEELGVTLAEMHDLYAERA